MSKQSRHVIEAHWHCANVRDWSAFAALLDRELHYEVPQTRERIRGAEGYLDLFCTWPGDWRVEIKQLICEASTAVSVIDFIDANEVMTGITFFRLSGELITHVTDYWPSPYEPPARVARYIERY